MQKPRNIAGPIAEGPDFWGREDDVNALWKLLDRGSVLLAAPRRHGKSSLMCALAAAPQPGWTVVQMDVEYIVTPAAFLTELTAALLQLEPMRRLFKKVKNAPGTFLRWITGGIESIEGAAAGIGEVKLTLRNALTDPATWPELTEQLLGYLQRFDGDLLLIIDEFPMMVANFMDDDEEGAIRFLKWFRAQRQAGGRSRARFLLGGSVNIEPRLEALRCEALLNDLQRFRLEQLTPTLRPHFIREVLDGERAQFEPGVPAEIARVADCGVHFFLQVLIQECLIEVRHAGRPLRIEDVATVYRDRVLGPTSRSRFSHYQSRLKEHYGPLERGARIVLAELARDGKRPVETLVDPLQRSGERDRDLQRILAMLESDYYILRDAEGVWFTSGFLRDWWFRNVPAPGGGE